MCSCLQVSGLVMTAATGVHGLNLPQHEAPGSITETACTVAQQKLGDV